MIYTGFGNECTIVKRSGTGQMQFGELLTVRRASDGRELDYRACELKATDGIREIAGIVETLGVTTEPPAIENSGVISTCDECGAKTEEVIGCPDGAEICQSCFDKGKH